LRAPHRRVRFGTFYLSQKVRSDWSAQNFAYAVGYKGEVDPLISNSPTNSEFIVLSTLGYSTIPEPSTIGLLCVGLLGLAARRRAQDKGVSKLFG
jgi:hypothetical protein